MEGKRTKKRKPPEPSTALEGLPSATRKSYRKCAVCNSYDTPRHRYKPEWRKALENHCDDAGRARLDARRPVEKFVCFRHFKPDYDSRKIAYDTTGDSILAEFCGPSWTGDPKAPSAPRSYHLALDDSVLGHLPQIATPSGNYIGMESRSTLKSSTEEPRSKHHADAEYERFRTTLEAQVESTVASFGSNGVEYLRDYLIQSHIGQQMAVGPLLSAFADSVRHLSVWESRIPICTSLLHACDTWNVEVSNVEIASRIGVSTKTLQRARETLYERSLHVDQIIEGDVVMDLDESPYVDEDDDSDYVVEESGLDRRRSFVEQHRRRSARNREASMNPRQLHLLDWASDHSAIVSGTRNLDKLAYSTYEEAHEAYEKHCREKGVAPYSFSNFAALMYHWAISPQHYDKYACPTCYLLFHTAKSILEIENDEHQQKKAAAYGEYGADIERIKSCKADFILAAMDYSRIHELREVVQNEAMKSKLSVLNFTVVFNGGEQRQFDYFSTKKQGVPFMKQGLEQFGLELKKMYRSGPIPTIHLWSDGGFKTYGTVDNLLELSKTLGTTIIHRYFAPYHGHNRCDAHFGRGKRLLRKYYPTGGLNSIMQVMSAFREIPETATELMDIKNDKEGNYSPWSGLSGIRSIDMIKYCDGHVYIATYSVDGVEVYRQVQPPEWRESKASRNRIEVTPYTPISTPIPDPSQHRRSMQHKFTVKLDRKPKRQPRRSQKPPSALDSAPLQDMSDSEE